MENQLGIEKAAVGIRHLIDYVETKDENDFNVVKDNIFEIKLWALITFFCNNIDELIDSIPDFILDSIFLMKPLELIESEKSQNEVFNLYGRGYKSNVDYSFRQQFELIRNCLSHCRFDYNEGMIYVYNKKGFQAEFDIVWLERLVKTVLSNKKLALQKGMSDVSIMAFVNNDNCTPEDFKLFCEHRLINIYKITSLTSNKETISRALNVSGISGDKITFELIFQAAVEMMRSNQIHLSQNKEYVINQLNYYFKEIEEMFGNKIKLELLPFEVQEEDINDELFWSLSFKDKLQYLLRKGRCNDVYMHDSTMMTYLLELLQEIDNGECKNISLLAIKDSYEFLLKIYANIYFAGVKQGDIIYKPEFINSFGGEARYVHAKNIYKEYIKVLNRYISEIDTYKVNRKFKLDALRDLDLYISLLEEVVRGDAYTDLGWKMRNSLIHNQIEIAGDKWRFFTTGKNLKIKRYSKKKEIWEPKVFSNNRPIWEMIISKESLLQLVDILFINLGIIPMPKKGKRNRKKPND